IVGLVNVLFFNQGRPGKLNVEELPTRLNQLTPEQTVRVVQRSRFKLNAEAEVFRVNASEIWKRLAIAEPDLGEFPDDVPPARVLVALSVAERLRERNQNTRGRHIIWKLA